MTTVLLFAEHELGTSEIEATVSALADLRSRGDDPVRVMVVVPYRTSHTAGLMDDVTAARGSAVASAHGDARSEAALVRREARRVLLHVVGSLRSHGHRAEGELVPVRDAVRDLCSEALARNATTVVVVCSPHRFAHLLHRDLEHRLRRVGGLRVVTVDGRGAAAAGTVPAAQPLGTV